MSEHRSSTPETRTDADAIVAPAVAAGPPPPTGSSAVRISSITRRFGEAAPVLSAIDLDIEPGSFVVLVGRSGCGKTTLLNAIAGMEGVDQGTIEVLGMNPRAARRHVGYMPARDALMPWRTAQRNVEYPLELRGVPRAERRRIAREQLEKLHLGEAGDRWPWQLSHGMRQRVALARTWAPGPDLLLMDEPFAALDAQTRASAQRQLLDIWERDRKTVVFVTHDLAEALLLADRVVLLGGGHVVRDLKVPFSRPRTLEVSMSSEFQALRHELWELIH